MNESQRLIATLKKLLKAQGYTYRRIAESIRLSEQSIKRMFANESFTLERLMQLSALLKMSLAEIIEQANDSAMALRTLTDAQERDLVADTALLLVAVCSLNSWSLEEITATYKFSKAECLKKLFRLEKLGFVTLLPGDRIRLNIARDFNWLPGGPIQKFFRKLEKTDFLASDFREEGEQLLFLNGMLSPAARERLETQIKKLREEFSESHRDSFRVPFAQRRSVCVLIAHREWEPQLFAEFRRQGK